MAFLTYYQILSEMENGNIEIISIPEKPFDKIKQVSEACIDLRIHSHFYKFKIDKEIIDVKELKSETEEDIDVKNDELFDKFDFPKDGYILKPSEIIFTATLEEIFLKGNLIGMVVGRANFAKLGLIINCLAPKCPPGLRWNFPLQILNCSDKSIRIYSFNRMVQILIAQTVGKPKDYDGPEIVKKDDDPAKIKENTAVKLGEDDVDVDTDKSDLDRIMKNKKRD
jgi:deoxycytidine triphosphate deaminase